MINLFRGFLLLFVFATSALAQSAEQRAAVDRLWDQAIKEQGPILTCAFTSPPFQYDPIAEVFFEMARTALTHMRAAGYSEAELDNYAARAAPHALRLPLETSFQDVVLYCRENEDWLRRLSAYDFIDIGREVKAVLAPKK